jgi:hypothetical protein
MREDVLAAWNSAPEFKDIRYPGVGPGPEKIMDAITSDEDVLCVLKCVHTEKKGARNVTLKCTAVVTSKTIYLLREGTFTKSLSAGSESIPVHTITGISRKRQLMMGTVVEISRAGNIDQLIMCNENQADIFVTTAKEVVSKNTLNQGTTQVIQQVVDPLDQIKKLKDLADAGVISQEEFESKKRELMDKI